MLSKRPLRVSIIAWYLTVFSGFSLISYPLLLLLRPTESDRSLSLNAPLSNAIGIVRLVVDMTAGIAMLRRRSWGRRLYLITAPILSVCALLLTNSTRFQITIGVFAGLIYLTELLLLLSPTASAYFREQGTTIVNLQQTIPMDNVESNQNLRRRNITGVVRKIFSALSFFVTVVTIGGAIVALSLISVDIGPENLPETVGAFVPLLVIGGFSCFIGLVLWDADRWRKVLGVATCILGGYVILSSAIITAGQFISENMMLPDPSFYVGFRLVYSGIVGVILIGLGILLILRQRQQDKRVPHLPDQTP